RILRQRPQNMGALLLFCISAVDTIQAKFLKIKDSQIFLCAKKGGIFDINMYVLLIIVYN
ncbi:hypothetical protein, partial [Kluyvera georgiana]|uniref:hypothetical protein n=1 Tax=Kluyvera georgiana TaxID=73098 RepID=UPI003220092D